MEIRKPCPKEPWAGGDVVSHPKDKKVSEEVRIKIHGKLNRYYVMRS